MGRNNTHDCEEGFTNKRAEKHRILVFTRGERLEDQVDRCLAEFDEEEYPTFGELLIECMDQTNATIEDLSAKAQISEKQLVRLRRDKVKNISFGMIVALCIAMKLSYGTSEELIGAAGYSLKSKNRYVKVCNIFLQNRDSTVSKCNKILREKKMSPLTEGKVE